MTTLALATVLSILTASQNGDEPDPRAELETAIPYAIGLLEKKETQTCNEKFSHPDELKRVLANRDMERIVGDFAKEKAKTTMAALEKIKDATPTMRDEGNVAVFSLDLPGSPIKEIVFAKTDGHWLLRNQSVSSTSKK